MAEYEIRRGHWKNIEGEKLGAIVQSHFGSVKNEGGFYAASFGAIRSLRVKMVDKTQIVVESEMDRAADTATQQKTIRAWNDFLEAATGYNAKQRSKRAQDKVKAAEEAGE